MGSKMCIVCVACAYSVHCKITSKIRNISMVYRVQLCFSLQQLWSLKLFVSHCIYLQCNTNLSTTIRWIEWKKGKKNGSINWELERMEKQLKCMLMALRRMKENRGKHTHTNHGVDNKIGISLLISMKPRRGSIVSIHNNNGNSEMAFVVNEYVSKVSVFFSLSPNTMHFFHCLSVTLFHFIHLFLIAPH